MSNENDQRIYLGECGCVRVESKHFRVTMQPEQFVEMLRETAKKQKEQICFFSKKISSNDFVQIVRFSK